LVLVVNKRFHKLAVWMEISTNLQSASIISMRARDNLLQTSPTSTGKSFRSTLHLLQCKASKTHHTARRSSFFRIRAKYKFNPCLNYKHSRRRNKETDSKSKTLSKHKINRSIPMAKRSTRRSTRPKCAKIGSKLAIADTETSANLRMEIGNS
jgi:hypothetical protein